MDNGNQQQSQDTPEKDKENTETKSSLLTMFAMLWVVVIGLFTLYFSYFILQSFISTLRHLPLNSSLNILTVIHRFFKVATLLIVSLLAFRTAFLVRLKAKASFSAIVSFLIPLTVYLVFSLVLYLFQNILFISFLFVFTAFVNSILLLLLKNNWHIHDLSTIGTWEKLNLLVFSLLLLVFASEYVLNDVKRKEVQKLIDPDKPPLVISGPGAVVPKELLSPEQLNFQTE